MRYAAVRRCGKRISGLAFRWTTAGRMNAEARSKRTATEEAKRPSCRLAGGRGAAWPMRHCPPVTPTAGAARAHPVPATDQWLMLRRRFKEEAVRGLRGLRWMPESCNDRLIAMIRDRADWCISRQRTGACPFQVCLLQKMSASPSAARHH
jgi:hypothetical protein